MAWLSNSTFREARRFADTAEDRMSRQISHLSHEIGAISHAVRKLGLESGQQAGHLAHDFADQAWHTGLIAAGQLGKQARRTGKAVREDPVPAIVAVVGFALLLSLVLGRKH